MWPTQITIFLTLLIWTFNRYYRQSRDSWRNEKSFSSRNIIIELEFGHASLWLINKYQLRIRNCGPSTAHTVTQVQECLRTGKKAKFKRFFYLSFSRYLQDSILWAFSSNKYKKRRRRKCLPFHVPAITHIREEDLSRL